MILQVASNSYQGFPIDFLTPSSNHYIFPLVRIFVIISVPLSKQSSLTNTYHTFSMAATTPCQPSNEDLNIYLITVRLLAVVGFSYLLKVLYHLIKEPMVAHRSPLGTHTPDGCYSSPFSEMHSS